MDAIASRLVLQLALCALFGASQLMLGMAAAPALLTRAGRQVQTATFATDTVPQEPVGLGWG